MTGSVVPIGVRHGEQIADGLEDLARDIRRGIITPKVCILVLADPGAESQTIAGAFFGRSTSMAETIGLLELAKRDFVEST